MSETVDAPVDLGKMYDAVTPIVDTVSVGQFHLSYWYDDADDTPIAEAAQRITRRVADALGLRAGDHLLDAGCGPGASAVLIAQETGARITGITISSFDVAEAQKRAKLAELSERVTFQYGDYTSLEFADGSFDAVMAIESLLAAPDLDRVLSEFARVLRPGGRFALCHCTKEAAMSQQAQARFTASIMARHLLTIPEWTVELAGHGLLVEEYTQFGPRVYGSKARYLAAIDDLRPELAARGVPEATVDGFKGGLDTFFSAGADAVGYAVIAGRKATEPDFIGE